MNEIIIPATPLQPINGLIILAAYLLILAPASWLIRRVLRQWIDQLPANSGSLVRAAEHPQAEYMLMGTFLSLAITLAIGLITRALLIP
jgi:hypothetical protein